MLSFFYEPVLKYFFVPLLNINIHGIIYINTNNGKKILYILLVLSNIYNNG